VTYAGCFGIAFFVFAIAFYLFTYSVTVKRDGILVNAFGKREIAFSDVADTKVVRTMNGRQIVVTLKNGQVFRFGTKLTGFFTLLDALTAQTPHQTDWIRNVVDNPLVTTTTGSAYADLLAMPGTGKVFAAPTVQGQWLFCPTRRFDNRFGGWSRINRQAIYWIFRQGQRHWRGTIGSPSVIGEVSERRLNDSRASTRKAVNRRLSTAVWVSTGW
jgi:hypothetical protein